MKKTVVILGLAAIIVALPSLAGATYGDVTTYAGNIYGGDGSSAKDAFFDFPEDITVDSGGNFYLADTYNNVIRKIGSNGIVSTVAGTGAWGDVTGSAGEALFALPRAIALDSSGNIYVADTDNHKIKKISGGQVSTLVATGLKNPEGVLVSGGTLYILDTGNNALKKVSTTGGTVETVTTSLNSPKKGVLSGNTMYIADAGNYRIAAVDLTNGSVSTLSGGSQGYQEGTGTNAKFNQIWGVTLDGNKLYVADGDGYTDFIRAVDITTGTTSLFANDSNMSSLNYPSGIISHGDHVYVCNRGIGTIEKFAKSTGFSETFAGKDRFGNRNGDRSTALFGRPNDMVGTSDGRTVYLAENNKIRKLDLTTGQVSHVIGHSVDAYREGSDNSDPTVRFSIPSGIEISPDGKTLYVTDRWNNRIRKIDLTATEPTSSLLTGSGLANTTGAQNNGYQEGGPCATEEQGKGGCAYFRNPTNLAISKDGKTLFITDTGNERIRKVDVATGQTSLLAGSGSGGYQDGSATAAKFSRPYGITIDTANTYLYVADSNNHVIRKIRISNGETSTLAGSGKSGYRDGVGKDAVFSVPENITMGADGLLYVSEVGGHSLRVVDPTSGLVKTITSNGRGFKNGNQSTAQFNNPKGVLVDSANNRLLVADQWNDLIRAVDISGTAPFSEPAPTVSKVEPNRKEIAGSSTDTKPVLIKGKNFRHGATAYFGPYKVNAAYVNSSTELAVELPFGKMPAGYFDVRVVNLDTQGYTLVKGFEITKGGVTPNVHYTADEAGAESLTPATAAGSFWVYDKALRGGFFVASGPLFQSNLDDIVVGTGQNFGPQVRVFNSSGTNLASFFAYADYIRSGIQVATGDVNGDGAEDIITAAGPTGRPHVRVFDKLGKLIHPGFFALDGQFKGGTYVESCNVNNDPTKDEILIAAGRGGGPQLTIHDQNGKIIGNFFAYDSAFRGGVKISCADINNDGQSEIVTIPEFGSPQVRIFRLDGGQVKVVHNGFYAFSSGFKGGGSVAGLDYNGDGVEEIAAAMGEGSAQPLVRIFSANGTKIKEFLAAEKGFTGGLNIAGGDVDGDGRDELITIPRANGGPSLRIFNIDEL